MRGWNICCIYKTSTQGYWDSDGDISWNIWEEVSFCDQSIEFGGFFLVLLLLLFFIYEHRDWCNLSIKQLQEI